MSVSGGRSHVVLQTTAPSCAQPKIHNDAEKRFGLFDTLNCVFNKVYRRFRLGCTVFYQVCKAVYGFCS